MDVDAVVMVRILLIEKFPERISELNHLMVKPEFCITSCDITSDEFILEMPTVVKTSDNVNNGEKILKTDSNLNNVNSKKVFLVANKKLSEFIERVKPEMQQLLDYIAALKVWIPFITSVCNCENYGAEIEKQTIEKIDSIEKIINGQFENFIQYHEQREELVTKVSKYPDVEDYVNTLKKLDENYKLEISELMHQVRYHYISVHRILLKILDETPRLRRRFFD